MANRKKVYGGHEADSTFSISEMFKTAMYMGNMSNQSVTRDRNRTSDWQTETDSYMRNFTPPGGVTTMTDLKALQDLETNLTNMNKVRMEGPSSGQYSSDTSRAYHEAAIDAVTHQVSAIQNIQTDYTRLKESNDKLYISGPQTHNDINYGNLLSDDGKLLFPADWVKEDKEGNQYVESARFFQTYLDVVNNGGVTGKIGQTMHQIMLKGFQETSRQLENFKGNSTHASLLGLHEFNHMVTGRNSIEGIRDYGSEILSNILFTNGDESVLDPEFAMHYHNAVQEDDFSTTSPLGTYESDRRERDKRNQQTFKDAIDNKHAAYMSVQSILALTGAPTTKLDDGGNRVKAYMVPIGRTKPGDEQMYTALTESEISDNYTHQADTLRDTIIKDSEMYLEKFGHRYDKFNPEDVQMAVELEKREKEIELHKDRIAKREPISYKSVDMWTNTQGKGGGHKYNLQSELSSKQRLTDAYHIFLETDEGKEFLEKEGTQAGYRVGMGAYTWLSSLSEEDINALVE